MQCQEMSGDRNGRGETTKSHLTVVHCARPLSEMCSPSGVNAAPSRDFRQSSVKIVDKRIDKDSEAEGSRIIFSDFLMYFCIINLIENFTSLVNPFYTHRHESYQCGVSRGPMKVLVSL